MKRTCVAHRTDGQPCKAPPIKGSTVCRVHGGSASQVRAAAQRRLLEAADPAAAELVRLVLNAESPRVRLAAVKDLLDRAAIGGSGAPSEGVLTAEIVEAEIARLEAELRR